MATISERLIKKAKDAVDARKAFDELMEGGLEEQRRQFKKYENKLTLGIGLFNSISPKRVVFSNPATIVFWNDGTKTVVKAMSIDTFDPERGYLQAYFEKTSGMSRTKGNKYLSSLRKQYEDSLIEE